MRINQPYLHLHNIADQQFEVQTLLAVPDGWKFSMVNEVISHSIDGERLILISMVEDVETNYDGTLQVTFPLEESASEMKFIVEVGTFGTEGVLFDVFGRSAVFLSDATTETDPADRSISGGGKKVLASTTQVIRDPV